MDFDSGRDIDAVSKDVGLIDYDVTHIDADAEFDPTTLGNGCVALGHGMLDFHGATGCVDRAGKFN